jgi:diadenosine tetraphosphate (Ap4A) HIT family hydrolase
MACPFCQRIESGDVTYEDGSAVAFPDGRPVTPGHTLVVATRHEPSFLRLTEAEAGDVWRLARRVCEDLQRQYEITGFNLGINVGGAAGQTIPHVHMHIIPRHEGDGRAARGRLRELAPEQLRDEES